MSFTVSEVHPIIYRIRCTQSFYLDGGSDPILKGEVFRKRLTDKDNNCFISDYPSQNPDQEFYFDNETLIKWFEMNS